MPARSSSSSRANHTTPVEKKPSVDFSFAGLIFTCMMMLMCLAAVNSQVNLIFGVFGLMVGVLLVSAFFSRAVLRRLRMRRLLPEYLVAGQPAFLQYEFVNHKRYLPSLSVTLGELSGEAFVRQPHAYLLHAAAGMTATVPAEVLPKRRGVHQFDRFQISTSFPFGFVRRAATHSQKDSILVHPPLGRVDEDFLSRCTSAEQGGARMRPRRGGTDEFYGVKEFRQGDNPRWIYWRRSARTGELVTKEMTHVAPPRLLILVDTHLPDRTIQSHAAIEKAIAMAASLVVQALDIGLAVGLCAWSQQPVLVAPSRGKRHSRDLLSLLSRLPLNQACTRDQLIDAARKLLHESTTLVVFTGSKMASPLGAAHSNWLLVQANSELARQSFIFDPSIDFEQCVPVEQIESAVR